MNWKTSDFVVGCLHKQQISIFPFSAVQLSSAASTVTTLECSKLQFSLLSNEILSSKVLDI